MVNTKESPLQKAAREMREAGIKREMLNPLEKHQKNPASLRLAVNAKCYDCVGLGHDANWKKTIKECVCTHCPLWPVRPYQNIGEKREIPA